MTVGNAIFVSASGLCGVLKIRFKTDLVHKQVESERVVLYPAFCESLTQYVFV